MRMLREVCRSIGSVGVVCMSILPAHGIPAICLASIPGVLSCIGFFFVFDMYWPERP